MSEKTLKNVERFADAFDKIGNVLEKLPRLIEMLGVGYFAGTASEKLGGDFKTGVLGGMAIDGLAHSQLPNNQVAGIMFGIYFTSLGIMNLIPMVDITQDERLEEFDASLLPTEERLTRADCEEAGGTPIKVIVLVRPDGTVKTSPIPTGLAGLVPPTVEVICRFPSPPFTGDVPGQLGPRGGIRK